MEYLYLGVFLLFRDSSCSTGVSLNSMVSQIRKKLKDTNLEDTFEESLEASSYIDIPEYDVPCFSVSEIRTYLIKQGFPRITPDVLPLGIKEVSYKITFSSISEYLCDISDIGGQK